MIGFDPLSFSPFAKGEMKKGFRKASELRSGESKFWKR
jgi:hypothetical protein